MPTSESTKSHASEAPSERAWAAPRAAYVHVPFCAHRCGYCNFTLVAGRDDLVVRYLDALETELSWLGESRAVETLYFGGGTPTHLDGAALERLLRKVRDRFPLEPDGEFSVEANPGDVDRASVSILTEHGVTRISLGAQSFNAEKLRALERDHVARDIVGSVELIRDAGLDVSLDLIFAAPGESLDLWLRDLERAVELSPDHISLYGLTYERGTAFWSRQNKGDLVPLDEELQRNMYLMAIEQLTTAGYEHYEVSNFARPGRRCRHNEVYWAGASYYAAGPGAARYVEGRRETNHRSTTTYIKRVLAGDSPIAESEMLSPKDRAREALVLGLRRIEGVGRDAFFAQCGIALDALARDSLRRFAQVGLLKDDGRRVKLTRDGLLVSDAMWGEILRV